MATVLFVGGVSPSITVEELYVAFASQDATVLASSVIQESSSGRCIGVAFVTVMNDDMGKAMRVTEVHGNAVCVLPVEVEAWVAPQLRPSGQPPNGTAAMALMASGNGNISRGSAAPGSLPSTSHAALQSVMEHLRAHLESHPKLTYNGKPFFTLLNECSQKRQMKLQLKDSSEGTVFVATITASYEMGDQVCAGSGMGPSKREAKHNAAAHCLDELLTMGLVSAGELITALTCTASSVTAVGGLFNAEEAMGGMIVESPAAVSAANRTQIVLQAGMFPRCAEVMRQVHSSERGKLKTIGMVIHHFAQQQRMTVSHIEMSSSSLSAAAAGGGGVGGGGGNSTFRCTTRLVDSAGKVVAEVTGPEFRSKQDAKQGGAAALMEYLLNNNMATTEGLVCGKQ